MFLTPSDREKLLLSVAGMVARDRLERGVRLNHPEAVALLSCWAIERAREGASVEGLMAECADVLSAEQVMDGVPELVDYVQVEATFPDGRKLVTMTHPIRRSAERAEEGAAAGPAPGALAPAPGDIELNAGREKRSVVIRNDGDRPVQIGSHIHLADVNPALAFSDADGAPADRALVEGFRLDIPAGTSLRFQPGDEKAVTAVELGGRREVPGIRPAEAVVGGGVR
ncbi:urease subunit gamma [Nocardiopsis suaedae]|uniref:urease n=1 Tax=Nocardiopsis suaedae TaxID=3018444 RepID=A0ABT4TT09_9ACTN|nr:urease subunit gamma [Nocardiopsis suaedae]MDA2807380.1 urease subunit gamma [Nocardiopsis suaedae]